MSKIIHNFLAGIGGALVISPDRDYFRPSGDFAKDAESLKKDVRTVGSDLRKKINESEYGKSFHVG